MQYLGYEYVDGYKNYQTKEACGICGKKAEVSYYDGLPSGWCQIHQYDCSGKKATIIKDKNGRESWYVNLCPDCRKKIIGMIQELRDWNSEK